MSIKNTLRLFMFAIMALSLSVPAYAGAQIVVVNVDGPGEGFNDPTPAAPVGGNTGTTRGQQRLIAFNHAASIWGATLDSNVTVFVTAAFNPLGANVLGSAGATFVFRDFGGVPGSAFPGAEFPATWYGSALADKRRGAELNPGFADINAQFSSNFNFYLGLDNNHGAQVDLVVVVLHELGHGLNFQTFVSSSSGANFAGFTDIYARNILDLSNNQHWNTLTQAQRQASAINWGNVVWDGPAVTNGVPQVLSFGSPSVVVTSPPAIARSYQFGTASFGPPVGSPNLSAAVVAAEDAANVAGPTTTDACTALTNAAAVAGRIALIERGTCTFAQKTQTAQNAGAIGVIIYNNAANAAAGPPGMAGDPLFPSVAITAVSLRRADGLAVLGQLSTGVNVNIGVDLSIRAGASANGLARLFAPNPVAPGSSISHYDSIAFRNLLMEPAINPDLTHSVDAPEDLTLELLRDVGWFADADVDGTPDGDDDCPNSINTPTVVIGSCDTGVANVRVTLDCTIADKIAACATSTSPGGAVSCIARLARDLRIAGVISASDSNAIIACAVRTALSSIEAQLAAMINADPGSRLADKIEDALAKLRQAFAKWNAGDLQGALGALEGAAGDLEAALEDNLLSAAVAGPLLNEIAGIARSLAQQQIDAAIARGGSASKINLALGSLAAGDSLLASGQYKNACAKYKDALSKAQGA